jgi:hypothetical protein
LLDKARSTATRLVTTQKERKLPLHEVRQHRVWAKSGGGGANMTAFGDVL